jgi:hypothetical protein
MLRNRIKTIEDTAPTCQPALHLIYTSYSIGMEALKFATLNLRGGWNSFETAQTAFDLVQDVLEKCIEIKSDIDQGGLIDWVLNALVTEDWMPETTVGQAVRGVVGHDFMEIWSGLVAESWADSVAGFALFKLPESDDGARVELRE